MARNIDLTLQRREDAVEKGAHVAFVLNAVEIDHEFVTAEAADIHTFAGKGGEPLCHGIEQPIADRMAERVIDSLEIVEIDDSECAKADRKSTRLNSSHVKI